jgi:outer membrane protein TolC
MVHDDATVVPTAAGSSPRPTLDSPDPGPAGLARPVAPPPAPGDNTSLPSTVSPTIAKFVTQHGLEDAKLPPPEDLAPAIPRPSPPPIEDVLGTVDLRSPRALVKPEDGATPRLAQAAGPVELGEPPLNFDTILRPIPLEPSDFRFPINLATALRLSDARPLMVAAAQASAWVAEAQLTQAKVLWVPMAMFGFDYIRHDGGGPDFNKGIMTAPSVNYFFGGGSADLVVNFTDAYFEPLIAREMLNSAHWDIQSAKNDAVFQVADAYFRVHQYRGMYAGALYTVERGKELVDKIANLSREFVPQVEVDRARNMLADLEQRAVQDRQEWRVASADLTQILRLDPRAVVVPLEHDHAQITLIDPGRSFGDLMPIALANRPELSSYAARAMAAAVAIRREKARPFVPVFMLTGFQHAAMYLQGGIFALGPNSSLNQWRGRNDASFQLIWQLEGFGIGNLARIKQQRGRESQAIIDLRRSQDMVAADVNRALARVQSAAARVHQADRALRTAIITFNGHLEGLGQTRRLENVLILTYRPQEAVYSLEQLNVSFDEYFTTVAEYNRAQFDLFHALGYPASEVTALRSPGPILPVNVARPAFLPPVGNGPPPATR